MKKDIINLINKLERNIFITFFIFYYPITCKYIFLFILKSNEFYLHLPHF